MNENQKWNIYPLWQLLRRTRTYREAVDQFVAEAELCNDQVALKRFRACQANDISKEKEKVRKLSKGDFLNLYNIREPSHLQFQPSWGTNVCWDRTQKIFSPSYDSFIKRYGDIIQFPYPYDSGMPHPDLLFSVWTLTPACIFTLYGDEFPDDLNSRYLDEAPTAQENPIARYLHFELAINLNFTDAQILETMTASFSKTLKSVRKELSFSSPLGPKKGDFEKLRHEENGYLKVYELMQGELRKRPQQIGRIVFPKNHPLVIGALSKMTKDMELNKRELDEAISECQKKEASTRMEFLKPYLAFFTRAEDPT